MTGTISKQTQTRRLNFLKRVQAVQETYQENYVEGLPTTVIWRRYIYPEYNISLQSLREYLAIPVKTELQRLQNHA